MAPKTSSQFETVREKSKEKILDAALSLFANEGYHATSISKIARDAGVSKGLMYNYFHSKEDLLNALLQQAFDVGQDLTSKIQEANTPQEQMKVMIEESFHWIMEETKYAKMLMSLSLQVGSFPQIQTMVDAKIKGLRPFYINLFKELGFENPEMEAYSFGALMDGLGVQVASVGDKIGLNRLKDHLIEKYCIKNKNA